MLRIRGPGVQDNLDLWLNAFMFEYFSTMSSRTGVTPHYAMFGREATLPVDWVFPTPSAENKIMYNWTGDMLEEGRCAYKSMREV